MEKESNRLVHVGFIWRLEKEKGIDILMNVIERVQCDAELRNKIVFHIIWTGSFFDAFEIIKRKGNIHLHMYGNLSHAHVIAEIEKWDLLCMPSRFLETFWLVALEALSGWVRVCWPKAWWLIDMVTPGYDIDMQHPAEDILKILLRLNHEEHTVQENALQYNYWNWKKNLKCIIKVRKNILIIHDYNWVVWGAEVYVDFLQSELKKIWCHVRRFWYHWNISRISRIIQAVIAPLAFWRYFEIKNMIRKSQADLIWMHSIVRYIWPWWVLAVKHSNKESIITHHDLGLIVARPSRLEHKKQVPHVLNFRSFIWNTHNPIEWILRSMKYLYLKLIWKFLSWVTLHIVPSRFMECPIWDISGKPVIVFPHTLIHKRDFISEKENI